MESWPPVELPFPARSVKELLYALLVRDLLHGASFEVEVSESGEMFQVELMMLEEIDEVEGMYTGLVEVEASDGVDGETLAEFLMQIIDETINEAENQVADCREIMVVDSDQLVFETVEEEEERWDLVIPEWFAPEDAILPFGFRSRSSLSGAYLPSDQQLDAESRIFVVPMEGKFHLMALPIPETCSQ